MRDHQLFRIEIYHNGAVFAERLRGEKNYLMLKAFLDQLAGQHDNADVSPRPVPGGDFYVLNDEQLAALSEFRRSASRSARGFPAAASPPRRR